MAALSLSQSHPVSVAKGQGQARTAGPTITLLFFRQERCLYPQFSWRRNTFLISLHLSWEPLAGGKGCRKHRPCCMRGRVVSPQDVQAAHCSALLEGTGIFTTPSLLDSQLVYVLFLKRAVLGECEVKSSLCTILPRKSNSVQRQLGASPWQGRAGCFKHPTSGLA